MFNLYFNQNDIWADRWVRTRLLQKNFVGVIAPLVFIALTGSWSPAEGAPNAPTSLTYSQVALGFSSPRFDYLVASHLEWMSRGNVFHSCREMEASILNESASLIYGYKVRPTKSIPEKVLKLLRSKTIDLRNLLVSPSQILPIGDPSLYDRENYAITNQNQTCDIDFAFDGTIHVDCLKLHSHHEVCDMSWLASVRRETYKIAKTNRDQEQLLEIIKRKFRN